MLIRPLRRTRFLPMKLACGFRLRVPYGSKDPNNRTSGSKCHNFNGIWALQTLLFGSGPLESCIDINPRAPHSPMQVISIDFGATVGISFRLRALSLRVHVPNN